VLDPGDLRSVADHFGVPESQVRRDHLVSHVLAALPALVPDVVFFGGTALARTHLPDGRLSEDVDLYGRPHGDVVRALRDGLPRALRREFPGAEWDGWVLAVDDAAARIQVLDGDAYSVWPTEPRAIDMRYRDVAPTTLVVPTLPAFVAMKTAAWSERRLSRDLYDLWALSRLGAVDADAATTFRHGTGASVRYVSFDREPRDTWITALAQQTVYLPPVEDALAVVREAFAALDGA